MIEMSGRASDRLRAACARDGALASPIELIKTHHERCRSDEPEGFAHRGGVTSHNLLAEFEEYLLKDEHGSGAAQDGERLPGKQRIRYPGQGGSEQRLHGTLTGRGDTAGPFKGPLCSCTPGQPHRRAGLTMRPSVASPSSPPKVMTGDMQAQ